MEQLDNAKSPAQDLSRRTIVKTAAWSVPVLAAAAATPMAAASTPCVKTISTETATYLRASATASQFTWTNLFGDGKDFTLTLSAVPYDPQSIGNTAINTTSNLALDSGTNGGEALPSVRLSLDTLTLANSGSGEQVTFSFALDGVATTVTNLSYKIKDIDGAFADDNNGGAERVSVSAGTGTIVNTTWVQGTGVSGNRWRLRPTAPNIEVPQTSTAGNVNVNVAATSSFTLDFIVNNSGRATNDRPNQNIWIGPFTFSVAGTCVP